MVMIKLKNISKAYSGKKVFENFSLEIEEDKVLVVLGESGEGKTTLLNILAGITDYEGEIEGKVSPVSYVFQTDRLIPNLTVLQNLELICPTENIDFYLDSVNLGEYKNSYPKALSAGMRRRVDILRAFLYDSKIALLDEPFVNLDVALKFSLINLVKKMHTQNPKTTIMVTHDIKEAVTIADRIIVLKNGKVIYDNSDINENSEKEIFDLIVENSPFKQ